MNRNLDMDMHPWSAGLTPMRAAAVRRLVIAELRELGLVGTDGVDHRLEARIKVLRETENYERRKVIARDEAAGRQFISPDKLAERIDALEEGQLRILAMLDRASALVNQAGPQAHSRQDADASEGRRPRSIRRFFRRLLK